MKKKGFTLLELLVVISIIGILVALGAVAFTTAQQKGRDARRRGDMRAVQNAYEQYYSENAEYDANCDVDTDIMPVFPEDPKGGDYTYQTTTCATDEYCVCARLENETGNANDASCTMTAGEYFCITNLQ